VELVGDRAVAEIAATRTQAEADGIDLDAKVPVNNPWMPKDFGMSVRWILARLNTEIARHAGHADIIRESIDGAVSYQLNAQAEGLPWPPEG
ncbi:Mini-circle protein, partial [Burkholderia multivorans]